MTHSTANIHESSQPQIMAALAAADSTDDVIYSIDRSGNQTWLNPSGHSLLGISLNSSLGKPWRVFIHENDLVLYQAEIDKVLKTGEASVDVQARLVSTLGTVTAVSNRLHALRNEAGDITGILGIARNTNALRRLEEQLHQSQKLETIGLLAGGIAHDFNNMLAAILGYAELMLEEKDSADADYRGLQYIQASTERAAALVKQLLLFTRKSSAELKPVRVSAILQETLQMLSRTLPKTIRVALHVDETSDSIMGDAGRIQQAMMNLCVNARDAMPSGGELRIEVDRTLVMPGSESAPITVRPGEYVRVRIQDTGHGVPPHVLEQIWTPFFTTKSAGSGTGLGLAVVQQIVQAHKGYVTAESQVGRGASFFVYLPASTAAETEAVAKQAEPPGGVETILVVDDEPVLLDLLRDILQPKGYSVLTADSPARAIEYVEAVGDQIDLIISDNMMPQMTGKELATEIRQRHPEIHILVCSGFSPTRESELHAMDYVSSYVQKPYQRRELLTRVRETLDSEILPNNDDA
jgi:two-component system cell cycle sensor histidine kinase/response regulator CckA